jgi:hypothetical protein
MESGSVRLTGLALQEGQTYKKIVIRRVGRTFGDDMDGTRFTADRYGIFEEDDT